MSLADERRREQEAYSRDQMAGERPVESGPVPQEPTNRQSWASTCAGWRVGIHERRKEDRLDGIYKCKWCGQIFDPPAESERQILHDRSLAYVRPQRLNRGKW